MARSPSVAFTISLATYINDVIMIQYKNSQIPVPPSV
jgi:hypothetical protein